MMTGTVGLEQPSRATRRLVDLAAANTLHAANALDALLDGDAGALEAVERAQREHGRIGHDLAAELQQSWRVGPDRERQLLVVRALGDVLDAVEALAWSWSRWPDTALTAVSLAIRDLTRAGAWAVAADASRLELSLERFEGREREARQQIREARAWLFAVQHDVAVAIAGETLLRRAERAVKASTRLRDRLRLLTLA